MRKWLLLTSLAMAALFVFAPAAMAQASRNYLERSKRRGPEGVCRDGLGEPLRSTAYPD